MKKILVGITCAALLVGCSNDKNEESSTEKVHSDKTTQEPKKKDNHKVPEKIKKEPAKKTLTKEKVEVKETITFPFISKDGAVDLLSADFINYYFSGNRNQAFGNVKVGMTKSEVEGIYGVSNEEGTSVQSLEGSRYGDIVVVYNDANVVERLYLNSREPITYDQVIQTYGKPSYDWHNATPEESAKPSFPRMLVYDGDKSNGFSVNIFFDTNNHVVVIGQGKDNVIKDNSNNKVNTTNGITKEQVKQFGLNLDPVNEEKMTGLRMNIIKDSGDSWYLTFTNVSNAGRPHEVYINKTTGDYVMYEAGTHDVENKGNIKQYIN